MIGVALRSQWGPDSLVDDTYDLDDPFPSPGEGCHMIAHAYGRSGLGGDPVDPDVAAPAGICGLRPCLEQTDRPDPAVHPSGLHVRD